MSEAPTLLIVDFPARPDGGPAQEASLRALAEDTLDVEKIEFVTDGERCPVYYIELK